MEVAEDMSKAFGAYLSPRRTGPCLDRIPGDKPQSRHVLRHDGDAGKAVVSPFVDEKHHPPVMLHAAAKKSSDSPRDAATTGSSLEWKAMEHTGAVDANDAEYDHEPIRQACHPLLVTHHACCDLLNRKNRAKEVEDHTRCYCRVHFSALPTLPPNNLEKKTFVCTAPGGDQRRTEHADRSPFSNRNYWRESYFLLGHVTAWCIEDLLSLSPTAWRQRRILDPEFGASVGSVRKESTRDPRLSRMYSHDCVLPGTSMPGTMSGSRRVSTPDSSEAALAVVNGDIGALLARHAVLGEDTLPEESTRDPRVSQLSTDDCVPPRTSKPDTMSGHSRYIGQLSDKDKSLLEERIKRASRTRQLPTLPPEEPPPVRNPTPPSAQLVDCV